MQEQRPHHKQLIYPCFLRTSRGTKSSICNFLRSQPLATAKSVQRGEAPAVEDGITNSKNDCVVKSNSYESSGRAKMHRIAVRTVWDQSQDLQTPKSEKKTKDFTAARKSVQCDKMNDGCNQPGSLPAIKCLPAQRPWGHIERQWRRRVCHT